MKNIYKYNEMTTFTTDERCDINELFNTTSDKHCSIAKAIVDVGVSTQLHAVKKTIERYVIIQGQGNVELNYGEATQVNPLDVVTIPAGQAQKITNIANEPLIFLCICTPRFKPENYINLEISEDYRPVSCQMHSELELAIMQHSPIEIEFTKQLDKQETKQEDKKLNKRYTFQCQAIDIYTKEKSEYLITQDNDGEQKNIRLDLITSFKVIK